jgi:hypothetical protein
LPFQEEIGSYRPLAVVLFLRIRRKTMKHTLMTAAFGAALALLLVLGGGGCEVGTLPGPEPDPPINLTGFWIADAPDSYDGGADFTSIVTGGRELLIKPDMSFTYTGAQFMQGRIDLPSPFSATVYPPIIVEGTIIHEGGDWFTLAPSAGRIDLKTMLTLAIAAAGGLGGATWDTIGHTIGLPAYVDLPDATVRSFRERVKIVENAGVLDMDDSPDTVNGGEGFLYGTWQKY